MSDSMEGDTSEDDEELENLTSKRKVKQKGPTNKIKRTKIIEQSSPEISEDEYRELLQDISEWFDGNSCISMLKVLYRDHVTNANTLHNATKMRDLLDNLHDSGNLSPTDLSILYDTINVTKKFGFKPKNKNLLSLFQNVRRFEISKFTSHRQKLVKLGMALIQDDVSTLDGSFNIPQKKYEDSWHLINDLEHKTVICEEKMEPFVEKLRKAQLHSAVKALTEEIHEYHELLHDISEWYDRHRCIGMLKVLYRDNVTNANTLHNATKTRDLLNNLHISGSLSPTDPSILYDTINVTKQFGFRPKNKKLRPLFQNDRSFEISKFTPHRQKLVRLGMALFQDDVATLDGMYNIPPKNYKNSWQLILDLEHRCVIRQKNMEEFIQRLKKAKLSLAVEIFTKDQVPLEVQARGPEAYNAFIEALKEGSKPIYQTRLMFVGPQRVGKTSLVKALTGLEFNKNEGITDGIDTSLSCTLSVKHITDLKLQPDIPTGKLIKAKQKYLRAVAEKMLQKKRGIKSKVCI
ncbi:uncharacterized protein LOC117106071 [Anneissia japonica]|uniref:uncharacterized protein LOC117106071 n=1 Tax=Anneissia japonica TaxID=1529436 RepID=UPI001425A722|nr:uncharacterized protein LOC117106071 [Anneissia japonica]